MITDIESNVSSTYIYIASYNVSTLIKYSELYHDSKEQPAKKIREHLVTGHCKVKFTNLQIKKIIIT